MDMLFIHMALSLEERLFIPLLLAGIFALLSFGFIFQVKGGTRRMKIVAISSFFFILGTIYCMAWHDQLTAITGWKNAWICGTILVSIGAIGCGKCSYLDCLNRTALIKPFEIFSVVQTKPHFTLAKLGSACQYLLKAKGL